MEREREREREKEREKEKEVCYTDKQREEKDFKTCLERWKDGSK